MTAIMKRGKASIELTRAGAVLITPFAGQQVDITGDVDISGAITKDGVAILAGLDAMVYRGATDCSGNPNYPAGNAGDTYRVSVAGKIGGASGEVVEVGDLFICNTDATLAGTQAQRGTAWDVIQTNIDAPFLLAASISDGDLTHAPDGNSVFDALALKADASTVSNVDNTSDATKPVSTAQAAADTAAQAAAEATAAADATSKANAAQSAAEVTASADATAKADAAQAAAEVTAAAALLVESNQRIGNDAQYIRTTDGAQTLLGGNAVARAIIIVVEIDTTFAAGDGAAPLFDIGETGNLTKFATGLTTGTAGDKLFFAGFLSANTALIITATQATGATSTGAIHVTALALPEA